MADLMNGWGTLEDVKAFQTGFGGLKADGIVGPKTTKAMNSKKGLNMLGNFVANKATAQNPSVVAQTADVYDPLKSVANYESAHTKAPQGLIADNILADPESYGKYDFSGYADGYFGTSTDAPTNGGIYLGTLNGKSSMFNDNDLHTADAGSITTAKLDGQTFGDTDSKQWVNGLSNYETLQGVAGLGSLGMNLYGMFGSGGTREVNKKNIELMDQQIANNRDIMRTRTERAGDIKKYFG